MSAALTYPLYFRLACSISELLLSDQSCQSLCRDLEKVLRTPRHLELDDCFAYSRKNVHVVALAWPVLLAFVSEGVEGTTAGLDSAAICVRLQLLGSTLRLGRRVGLRKHDRSLVVTRNLLQDFFCENLGHS